MIEGKMIKFGYGDVAVGGRLGVITFTDIKPPQEVGSTLKEKDVDIYEIVEIKAEYQEFENLYNELKNNNWELNKLINFKDYVLDFTKYNKKSIYVIQKMLLNSLGISQLCLAC